MDPSLFAEALDAGDRLVAALALGDLAAAEAALRDRDRLLDAIGAASLPPPPALADRLRAQHARFRETLRGQTRPLADALEAAGRAATARRHYAPDPRRPVVDTAPR